MFSGARQGVIAGFAFRIQGQDFLIFLDRFILDEPVVVLFRQLEDGFDILRIAGVLIGQGFERLLAGQALLEKGQEVVGRGIIAQDPVDRFAAGFYQKDGRGPLDIVPFVDGGPPGLVAVGPEENEILVEKLVVFGVAVKLLTQQYAAPSAT